MECYQKASSSELFLEEDRLRHCKTALLPGALKRLLCAQGKEKMESMQQRKLCLKKPQNTRTQQMVFTQPVKLGVVGEEGQRRLEIPVCVENVSSTCVQHRRSSWLLILRFQSFRRNMKFSKEKLYHCFFTAMLSRMCFLWFCFSLAELLNVAPAWDLQFSSPGDAFRDPIAQRLL